MSGDRGGVQVVARVAAVLNALQDEPNGLSLAQISDRVGLARSTVHRLIVALADEGFVSAASPKARVRLGPALARLGAASRRDLREELDPYLRRLAARFGETVDLAVLDRRRVRVISHVESPHLLRAVSVAGSELPLHSTANGKAFLAALPRADAAKLLPPRLPRFTAATITTRAELWKDLDRIRETGLALVREEHTPGICAAGAMVRDGFGPAAAVSVIAPSERFAAIEQAVGEALLEVAAEAGAAVGGDGRAADRSRGRGSPDAPARAAR
jgi:DNA-binding IclR family transcriptional regulator